MTQRRKYYLPIINRILSSRLNYIIIYANKQLKTGYRPFPALKKHPYNHQKHRKYGENKSSKRKRRDAKPGAQHSIMSPSPKASSSTDTMISPSSSRSRCRCPDYRRTDNYRPAQCRTNKSGQTPYLWPGDAFGPCLNYRKSIQ